MKLEKGKQYECIRDVFAYYTNGKVYTCENEGCLTDETGDEFHSWGDRSAKLFFKPHEPLPKVETMTMAEALKFIKEIKGVDVIIQG